MILKAIYASIATIITLFYLISYKKGKQYEYLVESLDAKEHPLKDLYIAGFAMCDTNLLALRGNVQKQLLKSARLMKDEQYKDYYAMLTWAQFLTIAGLILGFVFSLAGFIGGTASLMVLAIGVLFVMATWNLVISKMKEDAELRRDNCDIEFPNMVSTLALLLSSGMTLREAWETVAYQKEGDLYTLMRQSCDDMKNGSSDSEALYKFGILTDSNEIKKFSSNVIQGLEKGNAEIGYMLLSQVDELWKHKRQISLQKGEVAAGKLIIPLGITFAGIIMIIIVAALSSLSF